MNRAELNKPRSRLEKRESDILEAATALFAEEGFHGTSTRKIAAAAGVSEGTLFNYFATKNVLLQGILDDFYDRLIESAQEGMRDVMGTRERLLFLARTHLRMLMDNQALMMRLIQVYLSVDVNYYLNYKNTPLHELNYRYTRIFDAVVREGMARGDITAELELSAIRDLFFGGLEYGMRTMMGRNSNRKKVEHYVEALVEPLWHSMQPQHGGHPPEQPLTGRLEAACERLEQVAGRLERG